jgi:heme exporter protein CcmD
MMSDPHFGFIAAAYAAAAAILAVMIGAVLFDGWRLRRRLRRLGDRAGRPTGADGR